VVGESARFRPGRPTASRLLHPLRLKY
jgi:hypothetical protein